MRRTVYEKTQAIKLRKQGKSIGEIERVLKIRRSTLSGWLKSVKLTEKQLRILDKNMRDALFKSRMKAIAWHNAQKAKRLETARLEAKKVVDRLEIDNKDILDLALAFLYWGEGFKRNEETGIGNSDPKILKFFLKVLIKNYDIDTNKIRCELFLRADQNPEKMKIFWSKELGLPKIQFRGVNIDKRTSGLKTFKDYKGVCALRCANVAIQRKLVNIYKQLSDKIERA